MDLNDKIAIVTGAGQGIGKGIALKLGELGADLALIDKNSETVAETKIALEKLGRKAMTLSTDVTDFDQVNTMVENVIGTYGRVDILVNNVGWDKIEPFIKNTPDYWDFIIDLNLKSQIYCARAVLDDMIKNEKGKIVNLGSDAGRVGSMGETCYAGAKGGVIAFTKSLAREAARYKINVNCICPGPTDTPQYQAQPEKMRQALERAIPFRRVAKPEDIAKAAAFFASSESDYITGQVLSVSGGLTMVD
jgi:2-hydroxycyclohexanecarboxyl-CoA dehydrogenase